MSEQSPSGPLSGYRILDFTTVLFGPFAAQTVGDWGADVIKVERLEGDTWRSAGLSYSPIVGQFLL